MANDTWRLCPNVSVKHHDFFFLLPYDLLWSKPHLHTVHPSSHSFHLSLHLLHHNSLIHTCSINHQVHCILHINRYCTTFVYSFGTPKWIMFVFDRNFRNFTIQKIECRSFGPIELDAPCGKELELIMISCGLQVSTLFPPTTFLLVIICISIRTTPFLEL